MKHTLKLVDKIFYLLTDKLAKEGQYALTATGYPKKVDLDKITLWENGCCQVIGTSDPKWATKCGLMLIAAEIERPDAFNEWSCTVKTVTKENIDWGFHNPIDELFVIEPTHIVIGNIEPNKRESDVYDEWLKWMQENNPLPPMTNSKYRFAKKLLNDKEMVEMLSQVGVLDDVFKSVYRYIKRRD